MNWKNPTCVHVENPLRALYKKYLLFTIHFKVPIIKLFWLVNFGNIKNYCTNLNQTLLRWYLGCPFSNNIWQLCLPFKITVDSNIRNFVFWEFIFLPWIPYTFVTEILLKVALNTITPSNILFIHLSTKSMKICRYSRKKHEFPKYKFLILEIKCEQIFKKN
jgi:hypothetical protein